MFTYYFDVSLLISHWIRVDLAHVPSAIRLLCIADAQHPITSIGLGQ